MKNLAQPSDVTPIRYFLFLTALAGLVSLFITLITPADARNVWLLGYSRSRWIVILIILIGILITTSALINIWKNDQIALLITGRLRKLLSSSWLWFVALLIAWSGTVIGLGLILMGTLTSDVYLKAILIRIFPGVFWFTATCLQTLVFLPIFRYGSLEYGYPALNEIRTFIFGAIIITVVCLFVIVSQIGIMPPPNSWGNGWGDPGSPLSTTQTLLSFGISIGILIGYRLVTRFGFQNLRFRINFTGNKLDWAMGVVLWLFAVLIWINTPFPGNYFASEPQPPNYEYYPYSDAALYDIHAQNLLIGEGLTRGDKLIVRRPLYSFYVAMLNLIGGPNYINVINLQIMTLAFFPVLVYLIGKTLDHRLSGMVAALLVIFREQNSIFLSKTINVSHSKLLMSDLPTALLISLFIFLLIVWVKDRQPKRYLILISGGVLGLTMLIRSQAIFLATLPILLAGFIYFPRKEFKIFSQIIIIFLCGIFLSCLPWVWRNYAYTETIALEDSTQARLMVQRFVPISDEFDTSKLPDETDTDYRARMMSIALNYFQQNPGKLISRVSASFMHNNISSIFILPAASLQDTLMDYVKRVPYWFGWEGPIVEETRLPLIANLMVLGLGLSSAWIRSRWTGLIPLIAFWIYSLSNSVGATSGWRFILPVDWSIVIYFGMGLSQLFFLVVAVYFPKSKTIQRGWSIVKHEEHDYSQSDQKLFGNKFLLLISIGILFLGSAIPVAEWLIPTRYPGMTKSEALVLLRNLPGYSSLSGVDKHSIDTLIELPETNVYVGKALYPRYYLAGEGVASDDWPSFTNRACDRLGFYLIGPTNASVLLPQSENIPLVSNAADVWVIGVRQEDYIFAESLILPDDTGIISVYLGDQNVVDCPTTPPE